MRSGQWVKVSKGGYLTQQRAFKPGVGVWVRGSVVGTGSGQETKEEIAKDGVILHTFHCFHGEARMRAWVKTLEVLGNKRAFEEARDRFLLNGGTL